MSRSVLEGPFDFEITRVDCIMFTVPPVIFRPIDLIVILLPYIRKLLKGSVLKIIFSLGANYFHKELTLMKKGRKLKMADLEYRNPSHHKKVINEIWRSHVKINLLTVLTFSLWTRYVSFV